MMLPGSRLEDTVADDKRIIGSALRETMVQHSPDVHPIAGSIAIYRPARRWPPLACSMQVGCGSHDD